MEFVRIRVPLSGTPVSITRESLLQIARFTVAGLLVTGIHALVAALAIGLGGLRPEAGNGLAFVVANVSSYLLHTLWSFSAQPRTRNMFRFVAVSLFLFTVSVVVPGVIHRSGLHYGVGIVAVTIIIPPLSFFMHRFWTYR